MSRVAHVFSIHAELIAVDHSRARSRDRSRERVAAIAAIAADGIEDLEPDPRRLEVPALDIELTEILVGPAMLGVDAQRLR